MAKNKMVESLGSIARTVDRVKQKTEPVLDKILLTAAVNTGAIYGASEIIDRSDLSDPSNALIMMGTGALIATGNYLTFRNDTNIVKRLFSSINKGLQNRRALSWLSTGIVVTALGFSLYQLKPYAEQVIDDIAGQVQGEDEGLEGFVNGTDTPEETAARETVIPAPVERMPPVKREQQLKKVSVSTKRPAVYDELGYTSIVEHDFSKVHLDQNLYNLSGKLQRTLRWQPIYRAIERAYGLPEDLLGAMIMQESMGNPVLPNMGGDGGLGVVHVQCTTGSEWGMKIHGTCKATSDPEHGKQIKSLLEKCRDDPAKIQEYDDRGHLIIVLDTAARILVDGQRRHGSLDHGIQAYGPGRVGRNRAWRYMNDVKQNRERLRNPGNLKRAADDFQKRNGYPLKQYLERWHEMSNNWGLDTYIRAMKNR